MFDWAEKAKLDSGQRRASEIIFISFILSLYREASESLSGLRRDRGVFVKEKKNLETLVEVERRNSVQLISFLHGPGGSRKSTVIDLVIEYAREYCGLLECPFTSRTIVVTAMTGVAATIFRGETTHSAVYLNKKKPI